MILGDGAASGPKPRPRSARSGRARWLGGAALALALAPASGRADPPRLHAAKGDPTIERAQALHDEAARLYERGEYRDAIAKLEAALALDPSGKELVYNLALIHERLGELDDATRYYEQFLPMETDPKVREKVQAALKRLEGARKEMVRPVASSAPPPAALAPIAATAPAPVAPAPRRVSPWFYVFGGTAATGLVVGTAFGIAAIAKNPGDSARTGDGVSFADLEANAQTAHRDALVSDLTFAVSALAAGAALYVYLASRPRAATTSARLTLAPPERAPLGFAF